MRVPSPAEEYVTRRGWRARLGARIGLGCGIAAIVLTSAYVFLQPAWLDPVFGPMFALIFVTGVVGMILNFREMWNAARFHRS